MNKFSLGVLLLYFFSDPQSERAHLLSSPVPARSASIISLNIIHSHNFYAFPKSRIRIPTTSFRVRPVFCLCAGTLTEYTVIVFFCVSPRYFLRILFLPVRETLRYLRASPVVQFIATNQSSNSYLNSRRQTISTLFSVLTPSKRNPNAVLTGIHDRSILTGIISEPVGSHFCRFDIARAIHIFLYLSIF